MLLGCAFCHTVLQGLLRLDNVAGNAQTEDFFPVKGNMSPVDEEGFSVTLVPHILVLCQPGFLFIVRDALNKPAYQDILRLHRTGTIFQHIIHAVAHNQRLGKTGICIHPVHIGGQLQFLQIGAANRLVA